MFIRKNIFTQLVLSCPKRAWVLLPQFVSLARSCLLSMPFSGRILMTQAKVLFGMFRTNETDKTFSFIVVDNWTISIILSISQNRDTYYYGWNVINRLRFTTKSSKKNGNSIVLELTMIDCKWTTLLY